MSPPRLFGIPATRVPLVAVLRRGPSDWYHIGRWDLTTPRFEPGAWFRGTIHPQKCDLSPDGRWFAYSALNAKADWPAGTIYEAIARLPWLHALAAWEAGTTYTRGIHFVEEPGRCDPGRPDVGDPSPCLKRFGLAITRPQQFAVERRRGWCETEDTPARGEGDMWDERREVRMRKAGRDGVTLLVEGSYAAFRDSPDLRSGIRYALHHGDRETPLDAQWADWDAAGRLLVATTEGRLEIRTVRNGVATAVWSHDLARMEPGPTPPPAEARRW